MGILILQRQPFEVGDELFAGNMWVSWKNRNTRNFHEDLRWTTYRDSELGYLHDSGDRQHGVRENSLRVDVGIGCNKALDENGMDLPYLTQVVLFLEQTEETDGGRAAQREGWPVARTPRLTHVELPMCCSNSGGRIVGYSTSGRGGATGAPCEQTRPAALAFGLSFDVALLG